jgi:hypothetical protein
VYVFTTAERMKSGGVLQQQSACKVEVSYEATSAPIARGSQPGRGWPYTFTGAFVDDLCGVRLFIYVCNACFLVFMYTSMHRYIRTYIYARTYERKTWTLIVGIYAYIFIHTYIYVSIYLYVIMIISRTMSYIHMCVCVCVNLILGININAWR